MRGGVTHQEPACGLVCVAQLGVRGKDDEDFGRHDEGLVGVFEMGF